MKVDVNHYLNSPHYDLVTPDGQITWIEHLGVKLANAEVTIKGISKTFVGFQIDKALLSFNTKSGLGQLGIDVIGKDYTLDPQKGVAKVFVTIKALNNIGEKMLSLLSIGSYIGKLFAADDRRLVKNADYILQMLARSDGYGRPLLSLGGRQGGQDLIIENVDGRLVVYLSLRDGIVKYNPSVHQFLSTAAYALKENLSIRNLIKLHQIWVPQVPRKCSRNELLLVKTLPLHIRTVFAKVANSLLPHSYSHVSSNLLQPDTEESGDIYELTSNTDNEIDDIPLEFYSLEPYREHVFFSDRHHLQRDLHDYKTLKQAFQKAPMPQENSAAVYIATAGQLNTLSDNNWTNKKPGRTHEFPGVFAQSNRQALMVQRYIEEQASYPFLKAIEEGKITSQGVLLTRYFPSPVMKRMLLSTHVQRCLKGIYFLKPSHSYEDFFSHEDRFFLLDLAKFGIPVYWADTQSKEILQFIPKPGKDSGMFVPLDKVNIYLKASLFGLYGSNLIETEFEEELITLFQGLLQLKENLSHEDLNKDIPIALVTGGGPGVMELGNRVAQKIGILSCANIMDFRPKEDSVIVNEQIQNPHVEAKMTYRLDKIVERQAEFHLDFPIFLPGGIGTDFEYSLEEIRRKTGSCKPTPVLLFGPEAYWKEKISYRFLCNAKGGTISGSEWISNCFYCVESAKEALVIYKMFFQGTLKIGKGGPIYEKGFATIRDIEKPVQPSIIKGLKTIREIDA